MTAPKDELEAVRVVASALEGFDTHQQERVIRWARELLGLTPVQSLSTPQHVTPATIPLQATQPVIQGTSTANLKVFVGEKGPKNDVQFAATVAYFYRFEAPEGQRKQEINKDDLQEACRLVGRQRFTNPRQTLNNAHTLGLLDKGSAAGIFTINSVGENLVAMTLPASSGNKPSLKKKRRTRTASSRKPKQAKKK